MPKNFAFICGCGHSGTSLLANMFASLPDAYVPLKETYIFFSSRPGLRLARLQFDALIRGKKWIVEKTPRHIERLDLILDVKPRAKFIFIVRDGRDVVASLYKRTGHLEQSVTRWIDANRVVMRRSLADNAIFLRYEDLIQDPEAQLTRLCSFLAIEFHPKMLAYHNSERIWFGAKRMRGGASQSSFEHNELRNWQINQPIFDARGKWIEVWGHPPTPSHDWRRS